MNSRAMEKTNQNNVNDKSSYQRFINWDTNITIGSKFEHMFKDLPKKYSDFIRPYIIKFNTNKWYLRFLFT